MGWERMEFSAWQGLQPRKRHVPDREARTLLVSLPCSGRVPPLISRLTTVGRRLRSACRSSRDTRCGLLPAGPFRPRISPDRLESPGATRCVPPGPALLHHESTPPVCPRSDPVHSATSGRAESLRREAGILPGARLLHSALRSPPVASPRSGRPGPVRGPIAGRTLGRSVPTPRAQSLAPVFGVWI